MTPEELRESLDGMTFRHASDVQAEISEIEELLSEDIETFLPPEEVAEMTKLGEFYGASLRELEASLEWGSDPRQGVSELIDPVNGYHTSIDKDDLGSHPSAALGRELSDFYNQSNLNHKD